MLSRELAPFVKDVPPCQEGTSCGVSAEMGTKEHTAARSSRKRRKKRFLCVVWGRGCREGVTLLPCGTMMYCGTARPPLAPAQRPNAGRAGGRAKACRR